MTYACEFNNTVWVKIIAQLFYLLNIYRIWNFLQKWLLKCYNVYGICNNITKKFEEAAHFQQLVYFVI